MTLSKGRRERVDLVNVHFLRPGTPCITYNELRRKMNITNEKMHVKEPKLKFLIMFVMKSGHRNTLNGNIIEEPF